MLIRFILSLCILLSSGYGHFYAHAHQESIAKSTISALSDAHNTDLASSLNEENFTIKSSLSGIESNGHKLTAESVEEETESLSLRKLLEGSSFMTAIFYSLLLEYFFRNAYQSLSSYRYFEYFTCYKWFLKIQVIRI